MIKFESFFDSMHNLYFEQLMIEAQDDPALDELLWNQLANQASSEDPHSASAGDSGKDPELPDAKGVPSKVQAIFDGNFDPRTVKTKDQGELSLQAGTVLPKKFKFYDPELNKCFQVFSNIPVIVQLKTPEICVDAMDQNRQAYGLVKFELAAPNLGCNVDARIVVYDPVRRAVEQVVMFTLDVY